MKFLLCIIEIDCLLNKIIEIVNQLHIEKL